jgi:hypothetical protein
MTGAEAIEINLQVIDNGLAALGDDLHALVCEVRRQVDTDRDPRLVAIEERLCASLREIDGLIDRAETALAMIEDGEP